MSLEAILKIKGQVEGALAGIDQVTKAAQGLGNLNRLEGFRAMADLGDRMQASGRQIATPIIGLGQDIVETAANFESAMNQVQAVSGAAGDSFEDLRQQAMDLGSTTQFSASEAAQAQSFLAMAGFQTNEILAALPDTLNLAAAGTLDLGQAADITSNILSGMNLPVEQLGLVNNVLAETARSANTNVQMMGESFKHVAPVAASTGQSLEVMSAAIGILGDAGIQAGPAGTALRASLLRLVNPPREAAKVMSALGLSVFDATGSMRSFDSIIQDLADSGASIGQIGEIFGTEAASGIAALAARSGDLTAFAQDLNNVGNTAEEMAQTQMQGFNGQMKALQSAMEGLKLAIADSGLLDFVTQGLSKVTEFAQNLANVNPNILKFGTVIGGIVAGVGLLLIPLGAVVTAIGAIGAVVSGPVLVAIAGIAAAIPLIVALLPKIMPAIQPIIQKVQEFLPRIQTFLTNLITKVREFATGLWEGFQPFITQIMPHLQSIKESLGTLFTNAATNLGNFLTKLGELAGKFLPISTEAEGFGNTVGAALGRILSGLLRLIAGTLRVVAAFSTMASNILSTVQNLAGKMAEAGANIVKSLAKGITGAIGFVIDAMSQVTGRIAGFGPGSPVKEGPLTAYNSLSTNPMSKLMDMMAAGIQSNPLTPALNSALSPGTFGAQSAGSSFNAGGITVNVSVQGGGSDAETARNLGDELRRVLPDVLDSVMADRTRVGYAG